MRSFDDLFGSRSGTSPTSESGVCFTKFRSTGPTIRFCSCRRICLSQFHRQSHARINRSSVGLRTSSAIDRPVILESIFYTVPFILHLKCLVGFQTSHPYRNFEMTEAFRKRMRRPFRSLECVRVCLKSAYRDHAIATRWLRATRGSPSPNCMAARKQLTCQYEKSNLKYAVLLGYQNS